MVTKSKSKSKKVVRTTISTRRDGSSTIRFGNAVCRVCGCGEGSHAMAAMGSRITGELKHCLCGPGKCTGWSPS